MKGQERSAGAYRRIELLAIQRMGRLRPSEKEAVRDLLDSGASLSLLSISDVEAAIGRSFRLPRPEFRWDELLAAAERDALLLEKLGASFVTARDPGFPAALLELADPPFGLYLRGNRLPADLPAVAIVGTRYPTGLGLESARYLASGFAAAGIPVVSGLAIGIDQAAHRGALEAGGMTCAVLPCGIESAYPARNRWIASAILEAGGLLATEFPPGTPILKQAFPARNRIISGLARGLVVVEAPSRSGALISAEFALEEGRDVFVAASRLGGPRSAGLDRLAAEGAKSVGAAAEVLAEWGLWNTVLKGSRSYTEFRPSLREVPGKAGVPGESGRDMTALGLADALRAELGIERAI